MQRTHTCGELNDKCTGSRVTLCGWVHTRRDHGGVIFIDLRDRYGITQVVFDPSFNKDTHKEAEHLRREDVIQTSGIVKNRKEGMENQKLPTGAVEVFIEKITILNKSETPPLEIDYRVETTEEMRLKYRYLDLRNASMQKNIITRYRITKVVRAYLDSQGFLEIETPILAKSTPEGARDYFVPSRVHPGKFYALPQSPQLFKQILMISGFDRYFQIARCFRDEDLRADRQPEFTQIDIEMSFIDEEDIINLIEGVIKCVWKDVLTIDLKTPFKRLPYDLAMAKYGSDKPDLRFGLELIDITDIAKKCSFKVFMDVIKDGGIVKCINVKKTGLSRNEIDELIDFTIKLGAKGLAWMRMTDKLESSIVKFFDNITQTELIKKTNAEKEDILLFVADKESVTNTILGQLRMELGRRLKLLDNNKLSFLWIVDFPLFELDSEQRITSVNHPFTSPKYEDMPLLDKSPLKAKAKTYDIVLNGMEIGGGSIRIHNRELQAKIFSILGMSEQQAMSRFGFFLEAFKYGTPPHGGIALGLDRISALMTGNESIREVIAFPKTKSAESLMENAPSEVDESQLKELHISLDFVKAKAKEELFERIIDSLNREKIEYKVLEHKAVYTSEEAARVRGTELRQGAKALICKIDKGFLQAVISAEKELDIEKLREILGAKNLTLANADEVKKISGVSIGAVPPFANLFGIPIYVDKSVIANEEISFNAGLHTKSIVMKSKDLVRVTGAKVGEFGR